MRSSHKPRPSYDRRVTRILLVRHGQSEGNAGGIIQGRTDFGLTKLGRRQAQLTAERLAGDFQVFTPDLPGWGRSDRPAIDLLYGNPRFREWIDGDQPLSSGAHLEVAEGTESFLDRRASCLLY